jgi:sugar (pentulose or hexulose) kinase
VEALACWLQENLGVLGTLLDRPAQELIGTGGANRSSFVCQIKADATGLPFSVPDISEGAALGAALLAGVGIGRFDAPQAAQASLQAATTRYEPQPEMMARYDKHSAPAYRSLNQALSAFHHR